VGKTQRGNVFIKRDPWGENNIKSTTEEERKRLVNKQGIDKVCVWHFLYFYSKKKAS